MKHYILYILLFSCSTMHANNPTSQAQPSAAAKADKEVDKDTQVVMQSMETMIAALATFSQNPHNPVVAGTCALQALGAFIKMLIQIFDECAPSRSHTSREKIEVWFRNLPKEKQLQIARLMLAYDKIVKLSWRLK